MKTEILNFFFATLIVLLATFTVTATDGLILTGSVTGVTPVYKDKGIYFFKIDLILQFKNERNEPIIILRPSSFEGKKRLVFTNDYSSNSSSSEIEGIRPNLPDPLNIWLKSRELPERDRAKDYVRDFMREILKKEPTDNLFVIIPSDGYFEYRDSFLVENGFKIREESDTNPKKPPRLIVIPEFSDLKVEYQLSIGDRPEGIELLGKAKQNWRQFGNLNFDQDGNYSVKSNLILNILSN